LAHEFGHLAHKDTDTLLVMTTGNLIVSAIFTIWRFIFNAFAVIFRFVVGIASNSVGAVIASAITRIFIDFILVAIMNLWTKLGVLICLTSSRANEFLADQYAHELGLGRELANALMVIDGAAKPKGLWATLNSSHPATPDRVNKLNGLLSLAY
jgi:heat shock protein HtpX